MLRVGLTGGLATGKSLVGEYLWGFGCYWISADELGHQVLSPDGEVYPRVVHEFGSGILHADKTIDRKALARLVFDRPDRLALLSSLVHPSVIEREERITCEIKRRDPSAIVIVEAAILIETGSYKRFQKLVLAVCDEATQIRRAMKRSGDSQEEVLARIRRQMPLTEKLRYADYVIDTSGEKLDTLKQVRQLHQSLQGLGS
jgi:dephospho-CoA kinase